MSTHFVKIYGTLLTSSIWHESSDTRVVWITMLTMADSDGIVRASIPGLARFAGVSIEAAEEALECFRSPDKYSGTDEHDGRRIEEVDGGWQLLNHTKYRDMRTEKQRRDAERQRRCRKHKDGESERDTRDMSQMSHDVAPDTDTETDIKIDRSIDRGTNPENQETSSRASESVGQILKRGLSDGERERLTQLWHEVRRLDPPSHKEWWRSVLREMHSTDALDVVAKALAESKRKRRPAAFIASECAKHITLPPKPEAA